MRLKKERFYVGSFEELNSRADSPFRVIKNINDNTHKI